MVNRAKKDMTRAEIQLIRSLDDKRAREESGLFVAEGAKLVGELLDSGFAVRKIFYTGTTFARSEGERAVLFEQVSAKDMERASRLKTPTDCLALIEIPGRKFDQAALRCGLTLALDGVQNPGNVGTIIRLADWFGIRTVLCSADSADCWGPKVVQATMGAITRVAVHYGDLTEMLSTAALPVYGTFLEGGNIYDSELSTEGIVVMGSEGRGISPQIERLVTRKIHIPPYRSEEPPRQPSAAAPPREGNPESLNVAIAAAIVCSEFRRRG
jgi:TrmH family RNA methyltransferase